MNEVYLKRTHTHTDIYHMAINNRTYANRLMENPFLFQETDQISKWKRETNTSEMFSLYDEMSKEKKNL